MFFVLDVDEIIVPVTVSDNNWSDMMKNVVEISSNLSYSQNLSSYHFQNVYFLDEMLDSNFDDWDDEVVY